MKNLVRGTGLVLVLLFTLSGCALTDLTNSANDLIKTANDLMQQIDSRVASGELSRDLGDFLDQRIEKLNQELETTLDNAGGRLFDSANGTINLTFAHIKDVLNQINTQVLGPGGSVPALITTLSDQLAMQVDNLSSQAQDVIVLAFGNTFILLDKTTNSIILIVCVIFLAIGLLVFGIIFLVKKGNMTTATLIGLGLVGVYTVFFLLVIFVSPLRGYLIAGFNFGNKYDAVQIVPKITGVIPEKFVFGSDQRIILYGTHLNKLDQYSVGLYQSDTLKFEFPKENIIGATASRIILSNFDKNLGWNLPDYQKFTASVSPPNAPQNFAAELKNYGVQLRTKLYKLPPQFTQNPPLLGVSPKPLVRLTAASIAKLGRDSLTTSGAGDVLNRMKEFYSSSYKLPEGDFILHVKTPAGFVDNSQLMNFFNPPPPAPKPDISVQDIGWAAGSAAKKTNVNLKVRVAFTDPQSITTPFSLRVTVTPSDISPFTINLTPADLAAAKQNLFVDLVSPAFKLNNAGKYTFNVVADSMNNVDEENEGNNSSTKQLAVGQFVYDVTVKFDTFQSKVNLDDTEDEYHMSANVVVPGNDAWTFSFRKDGEPGNAYPIGQEKTYLGLAEGTPLIMDTSAYEEDAGNIFDPDDQMGTTPSYLVAIGTKSEVRALSLSNNNYVVLGNVTIIQRLVQ